jgi:hypothetical protein
VSLWFEQHALVIDPGTGAYYGNTALRSRLASWEAHNGPVPVSGHHTPRRLGPFLWMNHHATPKVDLCQDTCVMSLACDHTFVQRAVNAAQGYVEICDEVGMEVPHIVSWQLAPGWRVERERKDGFVCHHAGSISVHATFNGTAIESWEIVEREASPHFREQVTTQAVVITFKGTLTTVWRKAG